MIKQSLRGRKDLAKSVKSSKPAVRRSLVGSWSPYIYRVTIEPDADRFYAEVPLLPGCYSWGYTYAEALGNIKDALELWLEAKKEASEPIPLEKPAAIRRAALTVGVLV